MTAITVASMGHSIRPKIGGGFGVMVYLLS